MIHTLSIRSDTFRRHAQIWSLVLCSAGCGGYPPVSPQTYGTVKAMYAATNQKSTEQLNQIEQSLTQSIEDGLISENESKMLHEILDVARQGDWKSANRKCRRLMEDQIGLSR